MFRKFGHIIVPLRIPLLLVWIALALVLGLTAPSISDVASSDQTSFLPSTSNSNAASALESEKFASSGAASTGLLVFKREAGLTAADRGFAESVHNWLLSPAGPATVLDVVSVFSHPEQSTTLISSDGTAMLVRIDFTVAAFQPAVDEATIAIREYVDQGRPDGLAVHVTGEAGLSTDLIAAVVESTDRTTIVTIVLVIGLLFFIYRAPLAILIPLITISLAYLVARGILGYLAQFGWQISSLLDSYMVVLVFGAGTDYSLFFISRFREELAKHSAFEAAVRSVQRIGAVIAASAVTTIVGLSALGMARFGIVQTMGPGLALAVGITLLAGLTLTPALLSLFGRHLFWPRTMDVESTKPSALWVNVSNLVALRPLIPVVLITVLLAIPYFGLLQYRENLAMVASLPKSTDSRQGFDVIGEHFPQGEFAPAVVLLSLPESADLTSTAHVRAMAALQDALLALDNVDQARSIIDPVGDGISGVGFTVPAQLDQITAGLRAPQASDDESPARRLDSAAAQVEVLEQYVSELAAAFPDVADTAPFARTWDAMANLAAANAAVRAQAHPTMQLQQIAAQLRGGEDVPDTNGPTAPLAPVSGYLTELAAAFPDVETQPAYTEAARLLAELQRAAQSAPAQTDVTPQQQAAQLAQAQAASGAVAAQLDLLAGYFADRPDAVFLPDGGTVEEADSPLDGALREIADSLSSLRDEFAAYPHPFFIPSALPGVSEAVAAVSPLFLSADATTIRFYVILGQDPLSTEAIETLNALRDTLVRERSGPLAAAQVFLSGATAEVADIQSVVRQDLRTVGVVTVVGIFAVLALLLRSLVAPLYLVGTVVFSYGSSLGLSTLFFQGILGHEGVYYLLPLTVMVMLIALGADYNVFLVHRIREESATLPLREGVRVASARTGAIITAAGVILAGTFAALTASPLLMLFQMGAAVALGILIDALIVRSLLVPGIVTLVGRANWWPSSVRANWWPLLPAGTRTPLGGERGLSRVIVYAAVATLVGVTFATRDIWNGDAAGQTARAAADVTVSAPEAPTPIRQVTVATPTPLPTPTPIPPTPLPAPPLTPTPAPLEYVVQSGDSLSAIAQAFGVSLADLVELNEIADPNVISVGQRLRIPPP